MRRLFGSQGEDDPAELLEQQASPVGDPAEEVGTKQMMSRVWEEARRLSPQQRAALVLQVEEDLSTADIARVLNCSEATVRVHLHRAVSALRKTMARE